jgi:hypothetical protein
MFMNTGRSVFVSISFIVGIARKEAVRRCTLSQVQGIVSSVSFLTSVGAHFKLSLLKTARCCNVVLGRPVGCFQFEERVDEE